MAFSGEKYLKLWLDEAQKLDKERVEAAKSPVKYPSHQKEQKDGWFQSGVFHDGYQFGDVTKTLLGTSADIVEDLQKGVIGIGEGVVDTGAYLAGSVGGLFGADDFKKDMKDFIAKDLWDEEKIVKSGNVMDPLLQMVGSSVEESSLLGKKSDALVASGGQLLGTAALQGIGVPWYITTGTTSFGGEVDNALNQGAGFAQAGGSAAITAAAEMLSEKLFGGSGLGEKGLFKLDRLTNGIANKLVRALADYGIDMASEGAEEVVSQLASNLGTKLYKEENLTDILFSEEAIEGYIDSFVGGSILGSISNASKFVNSVRDVSHTQKQHELTGTQIVEQDGLESLRALAGELAGVAEGGLQKQLQNQVKKVSGEKVKAADVGRLYEMVQSAVTPETMARLEVARTKQTARKAENVAPGNTMGLKTKAAPEGGHEVDGGMSAPGRTTTGTQQGRPLTFQEEVQRQFEEANGYAKPDAPNTKIATQEKVNVMPLSDSAPLSLADQLRQEQTQNGGIRNDNTQRFTTGPAVSQSAGGANLPDGGAERNAGARTAEQTGVLAISPEQRRSAYADRSRATVARQNYARSLRLEKVSSLDLGLQNGTEARNIQVVPQENWDAEMSQLADRIYNETGKGVTYVMGRIQIRGTGGAVGYARGVITGDRIIVQADNLRIPMEQIADHEAYHAKVDFAAENRLNLNAEIKRHILDTFSAEQFQQVLDKYIVGMRGVIDVNETYTGTEFEAAVRQIEEEVFADAYAGINAFSAGANQFTGAVNEKMDQLYLGKIRNQDNGVDVATGPPDGDRYSIETLPDGKKYVRADRQVIFGNNPDSWSEQVEDYINGRIRRGQDVTLIAEDGSALTITTETAGKMGDNHTGYGTAMDEEKFYVKANAAVHVDELVRVSQPSHSRTTPDHGGRHGAFASAGWNYRTAFFMDFDGRYYRLQMSVANGEKGAVPYNIGDIEERSFPKVTGSSAKGGALNGKTSFEKSVPHADQTVKQRFSYADDSSKDISDRYSVDNMGTEDYDALENEFQSRQRVEKERFLRERLGDEGYTKFVADRSNKARQKKAEAYQRAKVIQQVNANKRKLHIEAETAKINKEEQRRLRNETAPVKAKKTLRSTVLSLFSIPEGTRAEIGAMIDAYADRLIKNGSLTDGDRKAFFDRMYDAGVMVMPADEYSAFARSNIADGRIYVSDSVKSDFGDDWADIRRRAFAAGIYLVNDRSASSIDQWNDTLSAEDMLPGLFDSEETDERTILERILQVAEEGQDEHLSLAEYTRRLSQQEGISEDEFLDNMERQLDWALRTFATSAGIEIETKTQEIRKQAATRRQNLKLQATLAAERQERKDAAKRTRDRKELRELQQKTLKQLQWLSKNRNRVPEELQATWDEVLGDIDLYAISAADEMRWSDKYNATWKDLVEMYDKAKAEDPNFFESKELERFAARLRYKKLEDLDIDALDALYKLSTGLRTKFYNQKNVINDEMQRLFAEVYTDSKREIESAPGENSAKKGKVSGWADKFLNMDQLTPMNVLQRMAGWDPDGAFYSMAKQLERGERDVRAYSVKAQKMLQDFLTEHEDWVKKADGQGKDGLWYKIEIPELVALELGKTPEFGGTIEVWMTPMQKIHMYLESKNQDNLRHMTGGRTFADKQIYSEGKRQEAFAQGKTVRMAPETVKAIVKDLTAEEMELAQILDRYYNTFATQEINKVSNILYGYDKAMGKNYAPIYTNRNYTKTEFGVFDTTAEGVGNLKGRQYAVNPSYNISAFDAFERHVDQTARFCGMAIPARNWTNLMNWQEKNNSTGDVITHKWGEEGKRYITDLITTLQAGDDAKSDTISSGLSKLQSNYITAIFGANPSIVLKQLGSIPLAGAYLDARNMPTPAQIAKIDRSLISKYTQELEWRTMGYATPETKQLKDNPNWTQTNKAFKFVFGGGAITAMDGWAASTLWPWAENKVRREHPELTVGTKAQIDAGESAFYKKVAEEFENAISRSQSVSDEIHQGRLRKSKNPITRAFTMFRSDSAQTYNALRQKIGETRYYIRTGAKDKVIQSAKKSVGTAFAAMLINAVWAEGISFLMALWKNKGKKYRDDEDELSFGSVAGEMTSNMLGSFAGIVTGGEEMFELIGNILTGDKWYGIETPGMEQLNNLGDVLVESGSGMREIVAGGWEILQNGGNLGEYFGKHSGKILGCIKDIAEAATMYLPGLPASNLEAYLIGALKWISPELGAAYDDLFSDVSKTDLVGTEGSTLESRIGRLLDDRRISESDDTAAALAALYEAGHKTAIPGDTPTSVSIDGEKHSLGEYQQQAYDTIWGGIVSDALDDMVASDSFKEANPKNQAKMLSNLYTYAAERAKAELFDEYEMDSGAVKNAAIVAAGATVAECITWNTITSEMKSGEKAAELAAWYLPESAKREIFLKKISDSRENSIAAFEEVGLSFNQFLQAYSKHGEINNMDLKAGGKAVEFSHWVNAQGYTAEQAAVVKDELTYFNMTPASSSRYDNLVDAGVDPEDAYDLTGALSGLQPVGESDRVSDVQKWKECVGFSSNEAIQLAALAGVMTRKQYQKVEIAYDYSIDPTAYVTMRESLLKHDADGNGSLSNREVTEAIDSMRGLTDKQKAVLWQLSVSSKSAKNNPYSADVGQRVLDTLIDE